MKLFVVLLSLLATALAVPVPDGFMTQSIAELGEHFEGDILLTEKQKQELFDVMTEGRTGLLNPRYRWPENIIYYEYADEIDADQRALIDHALQNMTDYTCLTFVERTTEADYVYVTNSNSGCYATLGRIGGRQSLNLGTGCMHFGIVVHEFIHSLGFHHSQTAFTRNDYVIIKWENIQPGTEHNFVLMDRTTSTMYDLPYDTDSLMHYGSTAFSMNGEPTIIPREEGIILGQRNTMSPMDIQRINRMYNCPDGQ